ncbi:DUF523 and DUF1722 domain-containing protein [Clostridium sediminicola]|uniref:DUF523 and DUF1722 domain-containing protein n=1 Tax=Clostridium sediminicola TaxID=3114879 RepID=UPI0031F1D893
MSDKPIILVSKCLGFSNCRYNGQGSKDDFIELLKDYIEYITVCPEVEIGLGIPRETIRLVEVKGEVKVIQSKNNYDFSEKMNSFNKSFLEKLESIRLDGVILKSRSPSCGVKDVKVYADNTKGCSFKKGVGFFAREVIDKYEYYPIEDNGRLKDYKLRELFLTKLFVSFELKNVLENYSYDSLLKFHDKNTLLFTMYNKSRFQILDSLLHKLKEDPEDKEELVKEYLKNTYRVFNRAARKDNKFNVLSFLNDRYKERVKNEEYQFIENCINKYKMGHLPFSSPLGVLKELSIRFNDEYIINQSIFSPFPESLVNVRDSGKVI